ncbi:hypothetical protein BT69DRAFT_355026 [Atractiella rhizophila]|nr:hypothetical protein BT69DRAFT_355026 [Atractiella rhizophila]
MVEKRDMSPGTYTYPVQIPVSSSLPPTLHCNFGAVVYRLKAYVQRAGVLTPNLQSEMEVHLVSCPSDESTEAVESIVIERFWETQMRYMVALSGKSFCVGSKIPVSIRLDPLAKVKVYRILVVLEEKVDYFAHSKKISRHEGPKRFQLLKAEIPGEQRTAILPITSDEEDAFENSPLKKLFVAGEGDETQVPSLADPLGPWILEGELQLPDCQSNLHFSLVHEKALLAISHLLRIVIRVERGDDDHLDSKGQRKLWDVIIESPLHILSCRCSQNHLPTYFADGTIDLQASHQCGAVQPILVDHGFHHHELSDLERPQHSGSAFAHTIPQSPTTPTAPVDLRSAERALNHSLQFARLVSGEINAAGARPPAYAEVVTDDD